MLHNVVVIGAGTMGNGIAHSMAENGFSVHLIDIDAMKLQMALETIEKNLDRQIQKGLLIREQKDQTLKNIQVHTDMETAVKTTELVIEAVTENTEVKLAIFKRLGQIAPAGCILATNTSSISVTKIAAVTNRAGFVIGMHFMNPVPVMKLVEVINGIETKKEVTDKIVAICRHLQKVPCIVKDYPGFIANRILMPMINEAIYSLYEGVAGVEEIDTIMKLGMAHPMGPLRLADFIGLDVCYSILKVLHDGFGNPKYAPCPLLAVMVQAGLLGSKSGEGFYKYSLDTKEFSVSQRFRAFSGIHI